jgi:hypothetical protein
MINETKLTKSNANVNPWWVRYLFGIGVIWFAISQQNDPHISGWIIFLLCIFAALMMWEILFAIICGAIAWAVLGAIAGLSTGTLLILFMLWLIYTKDDK